MNSESLLIMFLSLIVGAIAGEFFISRNRRQANTKILKFDQKRRKIKNEIESSKDTLNNLIELRNKRKTDKKPE